MKKLYILLIAFLIHSISSYAQIGYINTIAGTGAQGFSGDGGLALNATFYDPYGVAVDVMGNVYISDHQNSRIRKVNGATGIVSTIAGTSVAGFSGDGGLAINAQINYPSFIKLDALGNIYFNDAGNYRIRKITASTGIITTVAGGGGNLGDGVLAINASISPQGITFDNYGNLYISDYGHYRIRKVSASTGIITTVAGNGILGFSGDGGLAINAQINPPIGIAVDPSGNIYFSDYNHRIRKVTANTGNISTVTGNGTAGYSGDGGLAINAIVNYPWGISTNWNGDLFFSDNGNNIIRKISSNTGIITKVAGGGATPIGDGGLAINALLLNPMDVVFDYIGNMYIADVANERIRKVSGQNPPNNSTDSFSVYINSLCSITQFNIVPAHYSSQMIVKTWFGDGIIEIDTFSTYTSQSFFNHNYNYAGTYTIKHILYNGANVIDSISYPYTYHHCQTIPLRLYLDANSNCALDSTEHLLNYHSTIAVDSNGIPIDTIVLLGGTDYSAYGNSGDAYQFKVLSNAVGLVTSCPANGIITDTLIIGNNHTQYIGFNCSNALGFDLAEYTFTQTGKHIQHGHLVINNTYCTPQNGILTINYSPKYVFSSANPIPAIVSSNSITWNINNLSSATLPRNIDFDLIVPSIWLTPGDTIHSDYTMTPIIGDANPANNSCVRIDTVKSSYDPNEMEVSPEGNILSGTQLTYTIGFENTGNDTAQNIYILDTLSNYLDIHTLAMLASSNTVITSKNWNGSNWVLKLDFPNIKLLDSSHHNQCNGMVVFSIKTKTGLADGTVIPNSASIYFDDNPLVMTDTVINIIGIPQSVKNTQANNTFHIYPNPATSILNIDGLQENVSYRIMNVVGVTMQEGTLHAGTNSISTQALAAGMYLLELTDTKGMREVVRVVRE